MLQSKKKITGKAVLIFLICLTSVEGFIERTRQFKGETAAGETRLQQNQGSTNGDLKPSNDAMERRISQHIYDKRSFRTGSIVRRDTRTEALLTPTKQNLREFRLQEDRGSTQPTYRLLNSWNYLTSITPAEDDTIRTRDNLRRTRVRSSRIEEQRSTNPSHNFEERRDSGFMRKDSSFERSSGKESRIQPIDITVRHSDELREILPKMTIRVSRVAEQSKLNEETETRDNRITSRNTIELNRRSLDSRRIEKRDTASSQKYMLSQQKVEPNRRILDDRVPEVRKKVEQEDVRFSRISSKSRKLDTIREQSRESRNQDRQPMESLERTVNSRKHHDMRSSTVGNDNNRHLSDNTERRFQQNTADLTEQSRERRAPERRINSESPTDYRDRRIIDSEARTRQSRLTNNNRDRRSIEVVDQRQSSQRNIDVTNANQIHERSRSIIDRRLLGTRSRRYNFAENQSARQNENSRIEPSRQNQEPSLVERRNLQRSTSVEAPSLFDGIREDLVRNSRQGRDSRIETWMQDTRLNSADRRDSQGRMSFEDTQFSRDVREDRLSDARQSRNYRIELSRQNQEPSLVGRRNLQRSTSVEGSRFSDEIRENLFRNSRQGRDSDILSWMRDTRLNSADRRDLKRRMSFEVTGLSRIAREDRLSDARQSSNSRIKPSRQKQEASLVERRNLQRRTSVEGSRLSDEIREDLSRNSRRGRDSNIQTWLQDTRFNSADRRDSQQRMSFEDTRLSRDVREDRLSDARQSRNSRTELSRQNQEPSLVDRRNLQRSTSLQGSRLSDEIREDFSRNSRQGRDSRIQSWRRETRLNAADRRDSQRRMPSENTQLSRVAREDRLGNARQSRNSREQNSDLNMVDRRHAGVFKESREDRIRESGQREDSRPNLSRQARVTRLDNRRTLHSLNDTRMPQITHEGFRDSRQSRDAIIDVSKSNKETRLVDRRNTQRNMPSENTIMSRETRENRFRESRQSRDATNEFVRQNEDRTSQRSLELSDYTRKIRNNRDNQRKATTDDRFNARTVRQNFQNHFRQTRSHRYRVRENNRMHHLNDRRRTVQGIPMYPDTRIRGQFLVRAMRQTQDLDIKRSDRRYSQNIQSDDRRGSFRAMSSGSDSPRRDNKIASNNFITELNSTTTTVGFGDAMESLQQAYGHEASFGFWTEAVKLVLAAFLLGQIFLGSSDKYKLRVKNVISTLRLKKEKVQ